VNSLDAPTQSNAAADFFVIISGCVQLSVSVATSKTTSSSSGVAAGNGVVAATGAHVSRHAARPDPNQLPPTQYEEVKLAVLRSGQWFGVEALVQDTFQKAHILAVSDSVLLSISREEFRDFAEGVDSMHTNIADAVTHTRISLRSLPFFANVDELKLQQLSQLLEFRRMQPGDVIIREGELGGTHMSGRAGTRSMQHERAASCLGMRRRECAW
jgi:CRP-like cAMP-binding protein